MASTKTTSVAAAEAVTTPAKAAPVPATTTATHQDERAVCCMQRLFLLGAAKIARLGKRDAGGKSKRKCAEKAGRH
jgi:hypothetical protein